MSCACRTSDVGSSREIGPDSRSRSRERCAKGRARAPSASPSCVPTPPGGPAGSDGQEARRRPLTASIRRIIVCSDREPGGRRRPPHRSEQDVPAEPGRKPRAGDRRVAGDRRRSRRHRGGDLGRPPEGARHPRERAARDAPDLRAVARAVDGRSAAGCPRGLRAATGPRVGRGARGRSEGRHRKLGGRGVGDPGLRRLPDRGRRDAHRRVGPARDGRQARPLLRRPRLRTTASRGEGGAHASAPVRGPAAGCARARADRVADAVRVRLGGGGTRPGRRPVLPRRPAAHVRRGARGRAGREHRGGVRDRPGGAPPDAEPLRGGARRDRAPRGGRLVGLQRPRARARRAPRARARAPLRLADRPAHEAGPGLPRQP